MQKSMDWGLNPGDGSAMSQISVRLRYALVKAPVLSRYKCIEAYPGNRIGMHIDLLPVAASHTGTYR